MLMFVTAGNNYVSPMIYTSDINGARVDFSWAIQLTGGQATKFCDEAGMPTPSRRDCHRSRPASCATFWTGETRYSRTLRVPRWISALTCVPGTGRSCRRALRVQLRPIILATPASRVCEDEDSASSSARFSKGILSAPARLAVLDPTSSGLVSRRTAGFGNCRMFGNKG
jgi:hypothetical protein